MRGLDLGLSVLVTRGSFGGVDEGLGIEVSTCGGEMSRIDVQTWGIEGTLGHVGVGGSMETLGSIAGDESAIPGEVSRPRRGGVLHLLILTGEWQWAQEERYMSFLVHRWNFCASMECARVWLVVQRWKLQLEGSCRCAPTCSLINKINLAVRLIIAINLTGQGQQEGKKIFQIWEQDYGRAGWVGYVIGVYVLMQKLHFLKSVTYLSIWILVPFWNIYDTCIAVGMPWSISHQNLIICFPFSTSKFQQKLIFPMQGKDSKTVRSPKMQSHRSFPPEKRPPQAQQLPVRTGMCYNNNDNRCVVILFLMMAAKLKETHRKYHKISYQKRLKLIDLVQNGLMGVTRAAKKLRIKVPTAKVILSSWRQKGRVFKKRREEVKDQHPIPLPPSVQPKIEENSLEQSQVQKEGTFLVYYPMVYVWPMLSMPGTTHF